MNILIIGSEGFIGHHLVQHFLHRGWRVTGCDLSEYHAGGYDYHKVSVLSPDFESLFSLGSYDACINASGSGNVGYSFQQPFSDFESNSIVVARILDAIRKLQPGCRLLQLSSAAVYGNPLVLPVSETSAIQPLSPYGYHKQISETICRSYHSLYKVPVAIARPFSVYGNGLRKQLLWDTCSRLLVNDRIELFGSGNETRDFIHISDLAVAMECILQRSNFELDIYNIAGGRAIAIREVADCISRHFGGNKQIGFSGETKTGDPLYWQADLTNLRGLGFQPVMPFEEGVQQYVSWFLKQAGNS